MWNRLYGNISLFWVMIMCLYRVIHHLENLVGFTKIWRVCGWWAAPLESLRMVGRSFRYLLPKQYAGISQI